MKQTCYDINGKIPQQSIRTQYLTQLNAGDKVKYEVEIFNNVNTVAVIRGNTITV